MAANKTMLFLPGDGIGPEAMREVRRVIDWFDRRRAVRFAIKEGLVGGASIDAKGTPITDETMADALSADAVLFGAVGGPKWDTGSFDMKPERAILRLRKEMGLYANLRPATVFPELAEASTLKKEVIAGLDIMILRELTGRVSMPRGSPK